MYMCRRSFLRGAPIRLTAATTAVDLHVGAAPLKAAASSPPGQRDRPGPACISQNGASSPFFSSFFETATCRYDVKLLDDERC